MAALGLSRGMGDLQSSLQHQSSLVVAYKLLAVACGIPVSPPGIKPRPSALGRRVLATGPEERPENIFNLWNSSCMAIG